jgi:hypothetical protein
LHLVQEFGRLVELTVRSVTYDSASKRLELQ